jgi:addiction module RelE/StbE family toxin
VNIHWLRRVETDLDSLYSFISRDSLRIAEKEGIRVTDAVLKLQTHPAMGRPGRVSDTRELVVKPYIIAYRVKAGVIQILRVLHSAQDWPTWRRQAGHRKKVNRRLLEKKGVPYLQYQPMFQVENCLSPDFHWSKFQRQTEENFQMLKSAQTTA